MGELFLRAWLKSLLWVSFVQFYLYSILNQRDKLFREKILQSTLSEKKEKFSAAIKNIKISAILQLKSTPTYLGKKAMLLLLLLQLSRNQWENLIERIV